jgi:hypothetical protein
VEEVPVVPALCESTWEHLDGREERHYWAVPVVANFVATRWDAALAEKQAVVGYRDGVKTGKQCSASQGAVASRAFVCVTHDVVFFNRGVNCLATAGNNVPVQVGCVLQVAAATRRRRVAGDGDNCNSGSTAAATTSQHAKVIVTVFQCSSRSAAAPTGRFDHPLIAAAVISGLRSALLQRDAAAAIQTPCQLVQLPYGGEGLTYT